MTYDENEDFLVGLGLVGVRLRLLTYMICTYMYVTSSNYMIHVKHFKSLQYHNKTGRLVTYRSCTG